MSRRIAAVVTGVAVGLVFGIGPRGARAADIEPFQIGADFSVEVEEEGDDSETTIIGIGGRYFFKSVDPGSGPVEEADFLARVPYAGLMVGFLSGDALGADVSGKMFMIAGGFADENAPVSIEVMYGTSGMDLEAAAPPDETMDMSRLGLDIGCFVMPNLLVGLSYGAADTELGIDGVGTVMEMDESSIGFFGKWVQELGNGGAINVEVEYSSVTMEATILGFPLPEMEGSEFEIGVDYYFNQLIGVGIGLESASSDAPDDEATTFEIRATWNLGTCFGAGISYKTTSYDQAGIEDDTAFEISIVGRF